MIDVIGWEWDGNTAVNTIPVGARVPESRKGLVCERQETEREKKHERERKHGPSSSRPG